MRHAVFNFILILLLSLSALGAEYSYPYQNPYLATASSALAKARSSKQGGIKTEVLKLWLRSDRNNFPRAKHRGYLSCNLYLQNKLQAPLMIVIPGVGNSSHLGLPTFLADQYYIKGFHVLVVPSPLNWDFALAASTTGAPGITAEDTLILQVTLQRAILELKQKRHLKFSRIGVVGVSLGGLEAAYLSVLEKKRPTLGISRYLAINPPVDLKYAINTLDKMNDTIWDIGLPRAQLMINWVKQQAADLIFDGDPTAPGYYLNLDKKLPFSEKELQFLIGTFMRAPIADTIYASQLVKNDGLLKGGDLSRMGGRIKEAYQFSFMAYVEKIVYPRWAAMHPTLSLNVSDLLAQSSLPYLENDLRDNQNFYVFTNADDFLMRNEDLSWLERVMGPRLKVYPIGGHVGNIWFLQNVQDMVSIFQ